ncbi:hypothetical protein [Prauserella rugosa]|uniref:Uncharacterized protein n=1 Tax=Prauserella rugosa TaxID=43354 RepID=A0A660CFZ2_9PSEU|nr:hypothetical protein [Prauserella rugosa]TWH19901.1 hypothetical protein JD82_01738 [Prauserella rugosa]
MTRRALILAGTGMLRRVARELAVDGWRVVLPSRRYAPIPVGDPQLRSVRWTAGNRHTSVGSGKATWVQAHWDEPAELARKAGHVLDGPADLLVAWLHAAYRGAVLEAVEPLLSDTAPVVEVSAVPEHGDVIEPPDPFYRDRATQQVLLGTTSDIAFGRPLGHEEIERGVLDGVRRALDGRPTSVHQLGERRPVPGP